MCKLLNVAIFITFDQPSAVGNMELLCNVQRIILLWFPLYRVLYFSDLIKMIHMQHGLIVSILFQWKAPICIAFPL